MQQPPLSRHEAMNTTDSWVHLPPPSSAPSSESSDPDSSSDEEIITSGLRVATHRRRRHPHAQNLAQTVLLSSFSSSTSEGDEEDEQDEEEEEEEEEGEDVGRFISSLPLSNSDFSSSSSSRSSDGEDGEGEAEAERGRGVVFDSRVRKAELEHDAALRASLSTLLTCAAAARGLPRGLRVVQSATPPSEGRGSVEGLRVVHSASPPSSSVGSTKRRKKEAERKRKRRDLTRDTLVTLAITASAVVVLAAISFSAGYWVRREMAVEDVKRVRV